jgi:hypothetical protein
MSGEDVMRKNSGRKALLGTCAFIVAGSLTVPVALEGQTFSREGRWQFYVPINFVSGERLEGAGESFIDMSDDVGWGFGFGYHINERFMVGFETTWLSANYDAAIEVDDTGDENPDGIVTVGGKLDAATFQAVGQFNLLQGTRFTPFLQGKIGTTYTDSNIATAPPQGVCWWDPWWGYICDVWQPTYSTWSFSYGGAAGLRVQLAPRFFVEGSYSALWVDYDNETPMLDGFRLGFGWTN